MTGEVAATLGVNCGGSTGRNGVVAGTAILDMSHASDVIRDCGQTVPTLQARMGTGGNQVPLVSWGIGNGQANQSITAEHTGTLNCMHDQQAVCVTTGQFGQYKEGVGTLRASGGDLGGGSENLICSGHVRRLTPLECERLQGFPDGWTDIGEWTDTKGKRHKPADTPRYKACGNSIALPPWRWVLSRLCSQYNRTATLGSLFDGIGGFPLIWEELNGSGSCLWASEIEEFCIAVTKARFGNQCPPEST